MTVRLEVTFNHSKKECTPLRTLHFIALAPASDPAAGCRPMGLSSPSSLAPAGTHSSARECIAAVITISHRPSSIHVTRDGGAGHPFVAALLHRACDHAVPNISSIRPRPPMQQSFIDCGITERVECCCFNLISQQGTYIEVRATDMERYRG